MAAGDMIIFDQFVVDWGNKIHDLDGDTYKFGLVDNTIVPTRDTAAPHWGGTGTTDLSANEVATATSYTGPVTLANPSYGETANVFKWDFDDPSVIAQDAGGATDIYWMIGYNEDDPNNRCCFAVDLGGPVSLVAGTLTLTINASGIYTIT